jgi:hypothetical protein
MPDVLTGLYAPPLLDGIALAERSVQELGNTGTISKVLVPLAAGGHRVQAIYHGDGYPLARARRRWTLNYEHLGDLYQLVERLLADPGEHTLVPWKSEFLAYAGDGDRTEFQMFWASAPDFYTVPHDRSAAPLLPEVRLSATAAPLTTVIHPTEDYEAAEPEAGEAWFEEGGTRFKVATAPADGARIYCRICPVYRVIEAAETSRGYKDAIREPRVVVLHEA